MVNWRKKKCTKKGYVISKEIKSDSILHHDDKSNLPKFINNTILTFTKEQDQKYNDLQKHIFKEELKKLPPLIVGEINIIAFESGPVTDGYTDGYFVSVFIRNGRDLLEEFSLEEINLDLYDSVDEKVASANFKLSNFGKIKFGETRLWTFVWTPEYVIKPNADLTSFKIRIG